MTTPKKSSYSDKLRDPRWQKRRLEIMNRDNWKCLHCGKDQDFLNVHHVVYVKDKDPWEYDDPLLQTLCEPCHRERQAITDSLANAFRIALKDVPTRRLQAVCKRLMAEAMEEIAASNY